MHVQNQQMSVSLSLVGQSVYVLVATVREQPDLHIVIEDRLSSRFTSNSRRSGENKKTETVVVKSTHTFWGKKDKIST
jgi:hypothetical protein